MRPFEKIYNYSVLLNPVSKEYTLRLKISNVEEPVEHSFGSISELSAIVELLRDETFTFYDTTAKEIIIEWEPTGENDPKHKSTY
ncbi:MAG TPA: hypothetical protein VHO72_02870 [Bacteroidales bacterium]|nr:hypothetical protein [Bacteroidales bacterium]